MFQSTHPHGVRHEVYHQHNQNDKFQSTHPHGVRLIINTKSAHHTKFQSTHPHGVRLCRCVPFGLVGSFNPRTHTGCDRLKEEVE